MANVEKSEFSPHDKWGDISNSTTSVMWRNLNCLHMMIGEKFQISPHDRCIEIWNFSTWQSFSPRAWPVDPQQISSLQQLWFQQQQVRYFHSTSYLFLPECPEFTGTETCPPGWSQYGLKCYQMQAPVIPLTQTKAVTACEDLWPGTTSCPNQLEEEAPHHKTNSRRLPGKYWKRVWEWLCCGIAWPNKWLGTDLLGSHWPG